MSNRIEKRTTLYIQTIGFATDVTTSKRHNTTISASARNEQPPPYAHSLFILNKKKLAKRRTCDLRAVHDDV